MLLAEDKKPGKEEDEMPGEEAANATSFQSAVAYFRRSLPAPSRSDDHALATLRKLAGCFAP